MKLITALFTFLFARECLAQYYGVSRCYDTVNDKYYNQGAKFTREKLMGNTTLTGIYSCTCHPRGLLKCYAHDIPCWDYKRSTFIPKHEKFNVLMRGTAYKCTCMGGPGRYRNCDYAEGCLDETTNKAVADGEYYVTKRFSAKVRCLCFQGGPSRGSCRMISECRDIETNEVVTAGQSFTSRVYGQIRDCKCGFDGNPIRSSCQLPRDNKKCIDSVTGQKVSTRESFTIEYLNKKYVCLCGSDGSPIRGTCLAFQNQLARDPCKSGGADCDTQATCISRGNSYSCRCRKGYTGSGRRNGCRDVDECSTLNRCDENASCENTMGSYKCTCNDGYTGDGFTCSESEDHCTEGILFCDLNAECIPNDTSFSCVCMTGYTGAGHTCQDEDECTRETSECDDNAYCNNTVGSFTCTCNTGYQGDGMTCSKMCKDDVTGRYVASGDVFIKVKNGREMTCSCRDGEEIEGSCFGGEEPETTTLAPESRCRDESTGTFVESGNYFSKRIGFVYSRCLCKNGKAVAESCRGSTKLTETTTTQETSSMSATPAPDRKKVKCYDVSTRMYHQENETYFWERNRRRYACRCIRQNDVAISKCRPVSRNRN